MIQKLSQPKRDHRSGFPVASKNSYGELMMQSGLYPVVAFGLTNVEGDRVQYDICVL